MEKEQVWLPLQTVYNKELTVAAYLKEQGIEHYIPMTYELRTPGARVNAAMYWYRPSIT